MSAQKFSGMKQHCWRVAKNNWLEQKKINTNVLFDDGNKLIVDVEEKCEVWKQFINKIFEDSARTNPYITQIDIKWRGSPISKQEIEQAINSSKNKKTCRT